MRPVQPNGYVLLRDSKPRSATSVFVHSSRFPQLHNLSECRGEAVDDLEEQAP